MAWLLIGLATLVVLSWAIGYVLMHIGVIAIAVASYFAWVYYQAHHRG